MNILLCGSMAYDYIMDFPDSFKNHILPEKIHILNVCFVVDNLKKNFGGCAGNIAYNIKKLGFEPIIFSSLGSDAKDYVEYLKKHNIMTDYLHISKEKLTSTAHITTDKDDNQIIAFYNGALSEKTEIEIKDIKEEISLAILAPTDKDAMIKQSKELYESGIPFVFDPSHQLTAFSRSELMKIIGQAKFYIANDYEMELTLDKLQFDKTELLKHVEVLVVTKGDKGSVVYSGEKEFEIGICPVISADDPTGAGDAYRAGFFTAYLSGYDYQTCGQVGATISAYAIEKYGTQNHDFSYVDFQKRYENAFGEAIDLRL